MFGLGKVIALGDGVVAFADMDMGVRECVQRGAALLDEKVPDWVSRIDLDKLQLASARDCILGQLFEEYCEGLLALDLCSGDGYGFNGDDEDESELNQAWRELITARRAAQREGDQVAK